MRIQLVSWSQKRFFFNSSLFLNNPQNCLEKWFSFVQNYFQTWTPEDVHTVFPGISISVFPLITESSLDIFVVSSACVAPLFHPDNILFYFLYLHLSYVRNIINTCTAPSESRRGSPAVFSRVPARTFSWVFTRGLTGESPEKVRSLSLVHLHSHIQPPENVRRLSGVQCKSKSNLIEISRCGLFFYSNNVLPVNKMSAQVQ